MKYIKVTLRDGERGKYISMMSRSADRSETNNFIKDRHHAMSPMHFAWTRWSYDDPFGFYLIQLIGVWGIHFKSVFLKLILRFFILGTSYKIATDPCWWLANDIGSGNSLVPLGNKPLAQSLQNVHQFTDDIFKMHFLQCFVMRFKFQWNMFLWSS